MDTNASANRVEVAIQVGLALLLIAACFLILRTFLPLFAWGVILAIALYPVYGKLQSLLGGRRVLSAIVLTLLLLALLIVPIVLLGRALIQGSEAFAIRLRDGTLTIPPPPVRVETWPVIGMPLGNAWNLASTDTASFLKTLSPKIRASIASLFSASAEMSVAVLQFSLSIVVAGVLLANAQRASRVSRALSFRIFGDKGPEFEQLTDSTIRSITVGVLGVALIQSLLGGIGFLVAGMPGAGLWAIILLVAAVLQVAIVVLIPAVIYMFAIASTTKAVVFMVWCIFVGLIDNVLKPLLLGRGVTTPIAVVFVGAIGGFVSMGIIGLFVGAIVLSAGYKLFVAWLDQTPGANQENLIANVQRPNDRIS